LAKPFHSRYLLLAILLWLPRLTHAQNLLGLTASPSGGIHRAYQNPAWLADSPHQFYLSLGAANLHVNNNFVRYQAPYSLLRLITGNVPDQYRQANGAPQFETDYTAESLDGKPKNGTIWGELRGPAMQLAVGSKTVIGLSSRLRAAGQIWGASEQLLSALRASLASSAFYSIPSRNNEFSVNTNVYAEVAASIGHTLLEAETDKLMAGLTVKYVVGFTSGYFVNRGLEYQILPDPSVFGGGYMDVSRLAADFGFTSYLNNQSLSLRSLVNGNPPGRGVGFDFGLAYVRQPGRGTADPYGPTLRAGLALTDIGSVAYTGESYDIAQQRLRFVPADFNDVRNSEQFVSVLREKLRVTEQQNQGSFRSGLPTSLNLSADYGLPSGVGVQVAYWQDLRSNTAIAMHQPTVLAVVPRFEQRWYGAALPLSLVNGTAQLGLSLRAGPFTIGSDNVVGLLGTSQNGLRPRGVDVYAGLSMGFGTRTQPD
jgi:hypothetical protein